MGFAIDTVLVSAVNPGAGPTAGVTAPSGDSLSVRNYAPGSSAWLANIIRMGATAGFIQVRSPLLHDNVQGIRVTPTESPSVFSLPAEVGQGLQAQDTLIVELSGGAAETDIALLTIYYQNLPGASARLHSAGDIIGNIDNIKPVRVAVTSSATVGAWVDTILTTSENLLHANTDYALLGYMSNAGYGAIGIKGIETANLRIAGPGSTSEFATTDYYLLMSQRTGNPWIPVVNAANVNGLFASVCAATASVAGVIELIFAELHTNLAN